MEAMEENIYAVLKESNLKKTSLWQSLGVERKIMGTPEVSSWPWNEARDEKTEITIHHQNFKKEKIR